MHASGLSGATNGLVVEELLAAVAAAEVAAAAVAARKGTGAKGDGAVVGSCVKAPQPVALAAAAEASEAGGGGGGGKGTQGTHLSTAASGTPRRGDSEKTLACATNPSPPPPWTPAPPAPPGSGAEGEKKSVPPAPSSEGTLLELPIAAAIVPPPAAAAPGVVDEDADVKEQEREVDDEWKTSTLDAVSRAPGPITLSTSDAIELGGAEDAAAVADGERDEESAPPARRAAGMETIGDSNCGLIPPAHPAEPSVFDAAASAIESPAAGTLIWNIRKYAPRASSLSAAATCW